MQANEREHMIEGGELDENGTRTFNPDSHWDEYADYPVKDWQHEVADGDTRLGYIGWVNHQIEADEDERLARKKDGPS